MDFIPQDKKASYFKQNAAGWAKRILAISRVTNLVRQFKHEQKEHPNKKLGLLNFISGKELQDIEKPQKAGPQGGTWTRQNDEDLLLKCYDNGCRDLAPNLMQRLQQLM
jgi:hypothetical protein